ncbi:hypothetical protein ABEF95_009484 [Exophiala dermatitidis]|uniref:Uncharacterized protein n=1 Tax=Exophiala dermatitidis TaxID=5970 RepID=A0AAN6EP24_EXODE|nr:hypothetical protein HRR80_007331 [Exophiala dermatitidis]
MRIMEAHGDGQTLDSWGGCYEFGTRPDDCIDKVVDGTCDAVIQEAIMTPWWSDLIDGNKVIPIPFEAEALVKPKGQHGFEPATMPTGLWKGVNYEVATTDLADFVLIVQEDLPEDSAYLLTWCLVETRHLLENQYKHVPSERSPLTYPLDPNAMAKPSLPLHPGAEKYYSNQEILDSHRSHAVMAARLGSSSSVNCSSELGVQARPSVHGCCSFFCGPVAPTSYSVIRLMCSSINIATQLCYHHECISALPCFRSLLRSHKAGEPHNRLAFGYNHAATR